MSSCFYIILAYPYPPGTKKDSRKAVFFMPKADSRDWNALINRLKCVILDDDRLFLGLAHFIAGLEDDGNNDRFVCLVLILFRFFVGGGDDGLVISVITISADLWYAWVLRRVLVLSHEGDPQTAVAGR